MAPKELNFITGNKNKLAEVQAILSSSPVKLQSQAIDLLEVQGTIEEISLHKCRTAADIVKGPVLVEDTCLSFNAFDELPGPYMWVPLLNFQRLKLGMRGKSGHSIKSIDAILDYVKGLRGRWQQQHPRLVISRDEHDVKFSHDFPNTARTPPPSLSLHRSYRKWFLQALGVQNLHKLLSGFEDKSAQAICTFVYSEGPGHEPKIFQGRTTGMIVPSRGPTDFGWDSCFEYEGQTYAEMPKAKKNQIGHRGKALEKLLEWLKQEV